MNEALHPPAPLAEAIRALTPTPDRCLPQSWHDTPEGESRMLDSFAARLAALVAERESLSFSMHAILHPVPMCAVKNRLASVMHRVDSGESPIRAFAGYRNALRRVFPVLARDMTYEERPRRLRARFRNLVIIEAAWIVGVRLVAQICFATVRGFVEDFKIAPSLLTRLVLYPADTLGNFGAWTVGLLVLACLAAPVLGAFGGRGGIAGAVALRVPFFGRLWRATHTARVFRLLSEMISEGVPIVDALGMVRRAEGNETVSLGLARMESAARAGRSLADVIPARSWILDGRDVQWIRLGEMAGDLDRVFERIAEHSGGAVDDGGFLRLRVLQMVSFLAYAMVMVLIGVAMLLPLADLFHS